MAQPPFPSMAFLWPMLTAMSARDATSAFVHEIARMSAPDAAERAPAPPPKWTTRNRVALALPSMRLRDFSGRGRGRKTLICAPYALHGASIADFAPGHSLVETLRANGRANVFVTEWRSATPSMRFFSIDTLLADLNVAVDDLGAPVDLIGLCQGGWMALIYAARFPEKVRRLVLAGAPVDISAAESGLSRLARRTPIAMFTELLKVGDGRLLGRMMLDLWGPAPTEPEVIREVLQIKEDTAASAREARLMARFREWYDWTVDLPGMYYLEVVEWLYKNNRLAEGRFFALGRRIDLSAVTVPVLLLAGRDDEVVAPAQLLAAEKLLGSPAHSIETMTAPCRHLGLFMGAGTLTGFWPAIVRWLDRAG